MINECLEYFGRMESVRAPTSNRRPLLMLYGPITQAIRFAKASAVLSNNGHRIEAQVLARSALEYAVTVQYAYLRTDGLDRLEKTSILKRRELFAQLAQWHEDPTYLDLATEELPRPGAKGMPPFTQILDLVDPDHVILQSSYAVLSQVTHVRAGSRDRFFEKVGDELMFSPGRDDDSFESVTVGALAFAVTAATWVFARLTDDSQMLVMLDAHSDRLKIPVRYDGSWGDRDRAYLD